jgi:hypothetical protein
MVHGVGRNSSLPIACGLLVREVEPEELPPFPVPLCPIETSFNTRLSDQLLISGVRCRGGETTQYIDSTGVERIFICQKGQWLVTVDNVNTCAPNGGCTEIGVFPFVSVLKKTSDSSLPDQCTYLIKAVSPISDETRQDLNRYQVRFYDDQSPLVIPR